MDGINVYSEIGKLKKVLVHRPGREINFLTPSRLDELLFAAILEPHAARLEHDNFVNVLRDEGVETVELADLVAQTFSAVDSQKQNEFIDRFIAEAHPVLSPENAKRVKDFLVSVSKKSVRHMVDYMMSGLLSTDIGLEGSPRLIVDPMPNLYFTRDPFASVGNAVTIHYMKHLVRRREVLFSEFIFHNNPEYKNTPKLIEPKEGYFIEGGDVFIYSDNTLVIGVSNRTVLKTIEMIAKNLRANSKNTFKRIFAVNVPDLPNLMHLDTWLTMVDVDKFLYSPNMLSALKIWEIDLTKPTIACEEKNYKLEEFLFNATHKKPILIPVAGNHSQMDVDIETNFDATNYLTIRPGVVVGYSRNYLTQAALEKAGVTVLAFNGNQLSLGMGSARCMSMPLIRESVKE